MQIIKEDHHLPIKCGPCITEPKRFWNRTVASGESIKNFVESFRVDTVRKFLGRLYIGNFKERIILHPVSNLFFIQLIGKQVMAVHVKLKPERRPCRNAEIAETEFPVDKIEIVMKALALVKLQESLSGCFIMPWLVSITALHGRENVNQAFCFPGFSDDLLDAVIFVECMEFSDKLNFNASF